MGKASGDRQAHWRSRLFLPGQPGVKRIINSLFVYDLEAVGDLIVLQQMAEHVFVVSAFYQ